MEVKDLVPVDYSNQRVLLTAQVAEVYGTSPARIRDNFKRAKKRFQEGVHYFKLEGESLKELREQSMCVLKAYAQPIIPKGCRSLTLWTHEGCARHCKMLNTPQAWEMMDKLKIEYFAVEDAEKPAMTPQVFDKVGYIDDKGTAWFNAEFVARGLGFVQVKNDRVPTYGDKSNLFGNGNYINDNYTVVRWERVNSYLREFGFDKEVGKDDFLPENIVYRLAMKANNETAVQFQIKIANEILPSIRKHGYYSVNEPVETSLFPDDEPVTAKKKRRPLPEYAVVYSALLDNALVKIGLTTDFNRRIKEVRKETGQDVEDVFTTGNLPLDDARKLEATVKAKFHDKNKGGELYDVPFEQVKAAIDKHDDKFDKLLALANILPDSEEKTRLVLQAASLL